MLTENSILPLTSKTTPDIINVQNNSESENISPTNTHANGNVRLEPAKMFLEKMTTNYD